MGVAESSGFESCATEVAPAHVLADNRIVSDIGFFNG